MAAERVPVLAVLGPTAAGKSALGLDLARRLGGEIVSCDSVQVYRGFDVGSGKATPAERAEIPHHLLDVAAADAPLNAARWAELAAAAIDGILARGRVAIIVGGTGLYYRALVRGLFESPPADPAIRARHEAEAARAGVPGLHARLGALDPEAAAAILPTDLVRISRALEVIEQTGVRMSVLQKTARPALTRAPRALVLDPPLAALRPRISARVDAMLAAGLVDEVRRLLGAGAGGTRPLGAIGYRQVVEHLAGRRPLDETAAAIKSATLAYARRQRTWFRKETAVLRVAEAPDAAAAAAALLGGSYLVAGV